MNVLIFGASGQDGFYLSRLLQEQNFTITGVSRSGNFDQTDITDYQAVSSLIQKTTPSYIFHLAANSTTKHAALFENYRTISTGTLNILEAVKNFSPGTRVFISGSGLQFKNEDNPIKETDPFEARDAYSVSRIQSVYAARYYRTLGVRSYVGYFFNHDSPRRSERHVTKLISETARRIGAGSPEKLEIGDMDVVKEWTFAGDVVKGIWTLVQQEDIMEANISSGEGHSIREWIELCFGLVGKDWREQVVKREGFSSDHRQLVSNPSRIFSLGWKPETGFTDLAAMMMR